MAQKIHHFKSFSVITDSVDIKVDMKRLENNFNEAQFKLDGAIMTSMEPHMPMQSGQFIAVTKGMSGAIAGTGEVVAAAPPMGRFLYEGQAMVGVKSRSAWAKKGERKELSGKSLTYSRGGPHWFDKAKAKDGDNWVNLVKKTAGGG